METVKLWLLKPGTTIYCDESWVDTKVTDANGEVHYKRRYMWVIVKYRGLEALPVLNDLYQEATLLLSQCEQQKVKLSSKLHQALTYMTNHWEELKGYTEIGTVQIDNNCCERGARVTATYLTFVETCKLMAKAP